MFAHQVYKSNEYNVNLMALKQDGVNSVLCPKQGDKIEGAVLHRLCILEFFCP